MLHFDTDSPFPISFELNLVQSCVNFLWFITSESRYRSSGKVIVNHSYVDTFCVTLFSLAFCYSYSQQSWPPSQNKKHVQQILSKVWNLRLVTLHMLFVIYPFVCFFSFPCHALVPASHFPIFTFPPKQRIITNYLTFKMFY